MRKQSANPDIESLNRGYNDYKIGMWVRKKDTNHLYEIVDTTWYNNGTLKKYVIVNRTTKLPKIEYYPSELYNYFDIDKTAQVLYGNKT